MRVGVIFGGRMKVIEVRTWFAPVRSDSRAKTQKPPPSRDFGSGAYRDRTGDLRLAKPALSQLS
jgi:hypothetical protein